MTVSQSGQQTVTVPQGSQTYQRLIAELRRGSIAPGDRLVEAELAVRLGVSRTPVREAIRQLEAEGLVVHMARQGATVRALDYAEVMELYEMRAVLEGTAARLASRAASDIELDELESLNEELVATADPLLAANLNRQFHANLLEAAKNRFLRRSMVALQNTLMILGPTTLADENRANQACDEHRQVLQAMRARAGTAAEDAMRQHIEASQRVRLRSLRNPVQFNMEGGDPA